MARESKAAGSPGKCASCGKGLPKGIKEKMTKCPHCGKALNTDSSAIEEALPVSVERAALRLQEAIDRRDGASSNRDLVAARAGADVRADQLLQALVEAAESIGPFLAAGGGSAVMYGTVAALDRVARHRAGDFEGLHPRDRLGKFMAKLDASLRHAVGGAHQRRTARHGRELSSLRGRLPVRSALASPMRSLTEADVSAALAEATTPGSREKPLTPPGTEAGEVRPGGSEHRPGSGDSDPKRFVDKNPAASDKQHHGALKGDSGDSGTPRGHGSAPATPINRDKPITAQSAKSPAGGKGKADRSEASFHGTEKPVLVSHDAPGGTDDGNNAVPRGVVSKRKRMLREQQVRLLVEAGTAQDADEAHALLDRMGV